MGIKQDTTSERVRQSEQAQRDAPTERGRRGDTRARIQQVALELFAEQGYEGTSLREIAERLDVTKAALYYHFKSKEDIVHSFTEDYFGQLDTVIAWGREQELTRPAKVELLDRFIALVLDQTEIFRFLERNQASLGSGTGKQRFEQFRPRLNELIELLIGDEPTLRSRVRATTAIFAASITCMFFMHNDPDRPGEAPSKEELRPIVLEIASDLTAAL